MELEKPEVSAEVHFAQKLAANEKKIRDRAIKRLHKYLSVRSTHGGLSDEDLLKIWKGLFYCMWMQDKLLIQEELSKRITNLIHCFPKTVDSLRFVKVFFETNAREWNGIDKLRLDKFLMMVRDMLHQTFTLLSNEDWPLDKCMMLTKILAKHVMQPDQLQLPDGLKLHLSDIFVEEIAKVPLDKMSSKKMMILLEPFLYFILNSNKIELVKRVMLDVVYRSVSHFSGKIPEPALWEQKMYKRKRKDKKGKLEAEEETEVVQKDEDKKNIEDMEVEEVHNLFVLDKRLLLLLLFKQAEKKTTKAPNRAVVYKFMKKYPDELEAINRLVNNQKNENQNEHQNICAADIEELESLFLEFAGKVTDEQKKKKKRKNKKRKAEDNILCNNTTSDTAPIESYPAPVDQSTDKKKKRKRSSIGEGNSTVDSPLCASTKCDKENVLVSDSLFQGNNLSAQKSKEVSQTGDVAINIVSNPPLLAEDVHPSPDPKKNKKRKRRSSENCDELAKKKLKTSDNGEVSPQGVCVAETHVHTESPAAENTNFNARSRSQSPKKASVESVELVTYSTLQSPDNKTKIKMNKIHGQSQQMNSSVSTKQDSIKLSTSSSSPPKSSKSKKNSPPGGVRPFSTVEGCVKTPQTPTSSLSVKKSHGALDNKSDPGPSRLSKESKPFSTPAISMTPGTKKKVVFDLRRNKANKFKDYLMSLARQPDAPYEPTKSPSVGILKSPNVQQVVSTDSDTDVSQLSLSQILRTSAKQSKHSTPRKKKH
ncbi:ribosomal RNA processing protein 1 homolog B-like isoform X2 [Biomphalaria glabrata]|uniref:Ribosomal RNA processing protein 1 homolog B-like isoform X2 n=1 Tax=Biomphalaria glabrata TaxID=6526 RepID=A0A9W2YSZ1_BIOGL|nr:ribosomal RNA processing protein 1 homolog B-like isoform X2 [Biomphalaria glabrata]